MITSEKEITLTYLKNKLSCTKNVKSKKKK